MKEFNLSKKRIELIGFEEDKGKDKYQYDEVDVKEFIEIIRLKVLMRWKGQNEFIDWLNKKAGDLK